MTRTNTLRRAATTATAAISVLALAAPSAGAAAADSTIWAGSAEALALDLRITAPAGVLSQLPGGADTIAQKVSFTTAAMSSDDKVTTATTLLDGLLKGGALSNGEGGSSSDSSSQAEQDVAGIVQVGAGTVEYTADTAADVARSFSELAHLKVTVAPLFAEGALPPEVSAPVQDAVGQVTDTVNQLVGELNGALGEVETAVNEVTSQAPIDIPEVLPESLPTVPDVTKVDLVEIRKIWSESTVTNDGELVRSVANGGVLEASLLGGLIVVPALQYTSVAETAGLPGTATATTDLTTIAVRVGDSEVKVSGTTLTVGDTVIDLSSPELAGLPAGEVLGPVEELLASILNAGGLSISQGQGLTDIAEDGSSASASTSAFALSLAPLHAAGQADALKIDMTLLPTTAAVSAAPAPVPPAGEPEPQLPRTGGGSLAMFLGSVSLAGAGLLRRKVA